MLLLWLHVHVYLLNFLRILMPTLPLPSHITYIEAESLIIAVPFVSSPHCSHDVRIFNDGDKGEVVSAIFRENRAQA